VYSVLNVSSLEHQWYARDSLKVSEQVSDVLLVLYCWYV